MQSAKYGGYMSVEMLNKRGRIALRRADGCGGRCRGEESSVYRQIRCAVCRRAPRRQGASRLPPHRSMSLSVPTALGIVRGHAFDRRLDSKEPCLANVGGRRGEDSVRSRAPNEQARTIAVREVPVWDGPPRAQHHTKQVPHWLVGAAWRAAPSRAASEVLHQFFLAPNESLRLRRG